jgi:hypothetical protein
MTISDRVRIRDVRLLSDNHYILKTTTFEFRRANGEPWCWCASSACRRLSMDTTIC